MLEARLCFHFSEEKANNLETLTWYLDMFSLIFFSQPCMFLAGFLLASLIFYVFSPLIFKSSLCCAANGKEIGEYRPVSQSCAAPKIETLDRQTCQTLKDCSIGQSAVVWVRRLKYESYCFVHHLYAKFNCPVAAQNVSILATAHEWKWLIETCLWVVACLDTTRIY